MVEARAISDVAEALPENGARCRFRVRYHTPGTGLPQTKYRGPTPDDVWQFVHEVEADGSVILHPDDDSWDWDDDS